MFVWLSFPTLKMTSNELFERLAKDDIICVNGDEFYVPPVSVSLLEADQSLSAEEKDRKRVELTKRTPTIRLTFAAAKPDQIREGVKRLASCIRNIFNNQV